MIHEPHGTRRCMTPLLLHGMGLKEITHLLHGIIRRATIGPEDFLNMTVIIGKNMNKETQDLAWACLPSAVREKFRKDYRVNDEVRDCDENCEARCHIYEDIFGRHNLTSYKEPSEFICVERVKVEALQSEILKEIMDAHDIDDWQGVAHYVLDVMPRSFCVILGENCLHDTLNTPNSGELKSLKS